MQQSSAESFAVLHQDIVALAIALRDVEERSPNVRMCASACAQRRRASVQGLNPSGAQWRVVAVGIRRQGMLPGAEVTVLT